MTVTEIIPIGTGSAVPVKGRGFSCVALRRPESALLFDCGEGTQLRLMDMDIKLSRVDTVLITHLHGDHFFGLLGLLATMSLLHRETPVTVAGPQGLRELLLSMPGLHPEEMTFDVEFIEIDAENPRILIIERKNYRVWAGRLDHGVPAYGYRYQERDRPGSLDAERARELGVREPHDFGRLKAGKPVRLADGSVVEAREVVGPSIPGGVFAYITDTRPCDAAVDLARDADIVYHEATFEESMSERADATGHSTAAQAACIAREAGARRLLLSHFSARYRRSDLLIEEARSIFPGTDAAEELARYRLEPAAEMSEHR